MMLTTHSTVLCKNRERKGKFEVSECQVELICVMIATFFFPFLLFSCFWGVHTFLSVPWSGQSQRMYAEVLLVRDSSSSAIAAKK